MSSKNKLFLFSKYSDKAIIISTILLVVFGSFMVMSAEMGEAAGDASIITKTAIRQALFFIAGLIGLVFLSNVRILSLRFNFFKIAYIVILAMLLSTRFFGATNGAYAWIRIPGTTFGIQPSEFAKVFAMALGAKMLGPYPNKNQKYFLNYIYLMTIYVLIIILYQKDLGSGVVLAGICFVMLLIPPYKQYNVYHFRMILILIGVICSVLFLLSPLGTKLLEKIDGNYQVARFLASSNPFAYQYDSGYHVIMGLVSFATGGLFGLGYGNSYHKYMNFPNPSTDFILPIIVEELGIAGFLFVLIFYGVIFISLIRHSLKTEYVSGKMIFLGTFAYLAMHFVLNVGGVSGLIPLTGVPLLLISSGGSSLLSTMCAIGLCESEIVHYRKHNIEENESNSREV